MIRSNQEAAVVHVDPLSMHTEMVVLSGNETQVYYRDTKEHVSDRTLVPLVLMPKTVVYDPHGVQNGTQIFTAIEWFEGSPKTDGSNKISGTTAGFEIGDGSVPGFPKLALKVKKNTGIDAAVEYFAIATFTDVRTGREVKVDTSIKTSTAYYDALNYSVKIDQPKQWTIDPLQVVPDKEGYWKFTIHAQLYSGKDEVPDDKAAYFWEIKQKDGNAWKPVTDDDFSVWIDCKDSSGHFTKTLTFDARMADITMFRVRACMYEGTKPQNPVSDDLQDYTTVKVEMPHSVDALIKQTKGAKMRYDLRTPVAYEATILYNKGIVEGKDHLFQVFWYALSTKPGDGRIYVGTGKRVEFIPADKGLDKRHPFSVYAEVKMYAGHKVAMIGDSVVTVSGVPAIIPTYV